MDRGIVLMFADEWRALSARIEGIAAAAALHARYLTVNSQDSYGVAKYLGQACSDTLLAVDKLSNDYASTLPPAAHNLLKQFVGARKLLFDQGRNDAAMARAAVILLEGLRHELTYLLSNRQELVRSRTERAFAHLQWTLAVDKSVRDKWKTAFEKRETSCESLGAVHLLWHGIYAFKVNAEGARTDLVFSERITESDAARSADGLVLTEWKLADEGSAEKQFESARHQAALYAGGALAGVELSGYRFLVVVSMNKLPSGLVPPDSESNGVIYRPVNIVIEPKTPSAAARAMN
jgi:hypothetical protein